MSIYLTTINCTYHDSKHTAKEEGIDKKEDYSCISYQKDAKFNEGTNTARFWKFYQTVFDPAYQANLITRQAFTQLVSTITKEAPTPDNKNLAERLSLKLIKSIYYYYLPKKSIVEIAQIIRIVITETKGFIAGSILYTIFVNFKKKKEKN